VNTLKYAMTALSPFCSCSLNMIRPQLQFSQPW
jgi:hypothetical protein